jgi:hypothetical protein
MKTIYNDGYVQCSNVSTEVRVVLVKLAWLVSYRDTIPGVHFLHAMMANDAEVLGNTVLEVIHPTHSLPKGMREEFIIAYVLLALQKRVVQSVSSCDPLYRLRFKGCFQKIDRLRDSFLVLLAGHNRVGVVPVRARVPGKSRIQRLDKLTPISAIGINARNISDDNTI